MIDRFFRQWLDSDWNQRDDIDELQARERSNRRRARRARSAQRKRLEAIEEQCYELSLVTEAMAHLLIEHGAFEAERLQAMMARIQERRDAEIEAELEADEQEARAKVPKRKRRHS